MVKVALPKGHKEADAFYFGNVQRQAFNFFVVQKVHILMPNLIKIIFALNAHSRNFYPFAVFPIAAGGRYFAQVNLGVEVGGEGITVVAAVAVQNINSIDGVELVFFGISAVSLRYARVKAAAQQRGKARFFKFFAVCPLPAVIKIGAEACFFAAFFVNGAPFGVIGVFRFVVGGIHIIYAAG